MYVKYVDARDGPTQRFLGIQDVAHADADGVLEAVGKGLHTVHPDPQKPFTWCRKTLELQMYTSGRKNGRKKSWYAHFTPVGGLFLNMLLHLDENVTRVLQCSSWPVSPTGRRSWSSSAPTGRPSTWAVKTAWRRSCERMWATSSQSTASLIGWSLVYPRPSRVTLACSV